MLYFKSFTEFAFVMVIVILAVIGIMACLTLFKEWKEENLERIKKSFILKRIQNKKINLLAKANGWKSWTKVNGKTDMLEIIDCNGNKKSVSLEWSIHERFIKGIRYYDDNNREVYEYDSPYYADPQKTTKYVSKMEEGENKEAMTLGEEQKLLISKYIDEVNKKGYTRLSIPQFCGIELSDCLYLTNSDKKQLVDCLSEYFKVGGVEGWTVSLEKK